MLIISLKGKKMFKGFTCFYNFYDSRSGYQLIFSRLQLTLMVFSITKRFSLYKLQCLTIKLRLVNVSYSFQHQVRRRCSCISLFHCCPKSLSMRGQGRPDTCHLAVFFKLGFLDL